MEKPLKEAIELLIASGYLVIDGERLTFTDKILELDTGVLENKAPAYTKQLIKLHPKTKSVIPAAGQQSALIKFIIDCQVPQKIKTSNGSSYWANKYSKEAEVELQKILGQGYQLDILTAATKLYYKSSDYCENITNYIRNGTWLTHYQEMEKHLNAGTTEKHIKSTIVEQSSGGSLSHDR